jgi:hypothetical protein
MEIRRREAEEAARSLRRRPSLRRPSLLLLSGEGEVDEVGRRPLPPLLLKAAAAAASAALSLIVLKKEAGEGGVGSGGGSEEPAPEREESGRSSVAVSSLGEGLDVGGALAAAIAEGKKKEKRNSHDAAFFPGLFFVPSHASSPEERVPMCSSPDARARGRK